MLPIDKMSSSTVAIITTLFTQTATHTNNTLTHTRSVRHFKHM